MSVQRGAFVAIDAAGACAAPELASRLTLSVVSHGHGNMVLDLLSDLAAIASLRDAMVIVTLNVPEPKLDRLLTRTFGALRVQVLRNARPAGFATNHNRAFEHCRTEFFALLNPDLRLPGDVFAPLVGALSARSRSALAAPRIVDDLGHVQDSVRGNLTPWSLLRRHVGSGDGDVEPFWLAGMLMVLRSEAFAAIGGLDERFFLYCEDYDLCLRLRLDGWDLEHLDTVVAVHRAQRDSRRSWRHLRWHLASLARVWTSGAFRRSFGQLPGRMR